MKKIIVSALVLVLGTPLFAQEYSKTKEELYPIDVNPQRAVKGKYAEFDAYVRKAFEAYGIAGLSIAVVKDQQVVFSNAYGVKDKKTGDLMDVNAVFGIASLSKAFTAAAVGMLVDEGKIKWSDKVVDVLPSFKLYDAYATANFTVEDLLAHRSGYNTFDGDLLWYGTDYSRAEIMERISNLPNKTSFRESYGYNNIMFIVAGELVAKVSGMSWDQFIETRFFQPLKMTSSRTSTTQFTDNDNLAIPHVKGISSDFLNYDNSGGAAALNSSVMDLSNWLKMWTNNGVFNGDTLLQAKTVNYILSLQTPQSVSNFDQSNGINFKGYGLGWFLFDYDGKKVAHHGGGLPGFISKIGFVQKENLGFVVLTNDESSLSAALMYCILDEFMETENDKDWADLYLGFSKRYEERLEKERKEQISERKKKTKPSVDLEKYVGTYEDVMYGTAVVKLEKRTLKIVLNPAKELFNSEMEHWEDDVFQIKFNDGFLPEGYVKFDVKGGNVDSFIIDLPNPDFHFYHLNFKKK
jgi:CubicO group peptidase (beta-lactamase class C family)